jgi:hypothetical protein
MSQSEIENSQNGAKVQSPCFSLLLKKERKESFGESTNVVDRGKDKRKLFFAAIFRCYVLVVLFFGFMVFGKTYFVLVTVHFSLPVNLLSAQHEWKTDGLTDCCVKYNEGIA